jgi:hypothetical protein
MDTALIVIALLIWCASGFSAAQQLMRAQFWKYPRLWEGPDDGRGNAILCLVVGPIGLAATWAVYGLLWPPVPSRAKALFIPREDGRLRLIREGMEEIERRATNSTGAGR